MYVPDETQRALVICERILDQTRTGLLTGDFDIFRASFLLPHVHTTMEGTSVLETLDDLRTVHDRVTAEYRRRGVDELHRVMVSARYVTPHAIEARLISHVLAGGERVIDPYPVQAELVLCGRDWLIASANYAVGLSNEWVAAALMPDAFPSEIAPPPPPSRHRRESPFDDT